MQSNTEDVGRVKKTFTQEEVGKIVAKVTEGKWNYKEKEDTSKLFTALQTA